MAWNESTNGVLVNGSALSDTAGVANNVSSYLGTEVEGTITWHMYPGVNLDLIGSVVFPGSGLEDLMEAQAETVALNNNVAADGINYDETPFTIQGRLMIFIDQFFK